MEPLAPGMRRVGKLLQRMPGSSVATQTREQVIRSGETKVPEAFASILMGTKPRGVATDDRTVDGIPIRIYTPSSKSGTTGAAAARRPLIVYFHGGGFVFGDLRGGDWICGSVSAGVGAIVVSVQYRLAPAHPFPAGVEDCYAGLVWASRHADELGADAGRIGVMGESAGGNLAAVVALMARNSEGPPIRHQALLYPVIGVTDTESRRVNTDAFILSGADMKKFDEYYAADTTDWRYSPILAESLAGLPPAIIEVGEHDPLHDDGVLYADALRAAGVAVKLVNFPAMPHGFLNFPRFARDAKPGIRAVIDAQREALT